MKESLIVLIIVFFSVDCNNKTSTAIKPKKRDSSILYPYSPIYSEFETGKAAYAKNVLEVWRQFETGNLMSTVNKFADSLTLIFKDAIYNGKADSVLTIFKKRREKYSDVQCYVDSWQPVHAKQTNDDLVLVWGRQDCTIEKGKPRDYLVVHEIWKFDKQGKIRAMIQYITHPF